MWKGSSSPIFARSAAMISGVARGPRMMVAGSPGTACIITYSSVTASITVTIASRTRRRKYSAISGRSRAVGPAAAQRASKNRNSGRPSGRSAGTITVSRNMTGLASWVRKR